MDGSLCSIPRLARLLWRLLAISSLNRCPPPSHEAAGHSISDEFKALATAASKVEIAPGIALDRAFWTHAQALHSRRVYARLRELARQWPSGHAPQGFLALFAQEIRGATIQVAGCEPVVLANRVQLLDPNKVDPDMADELTRKQLNVVNPNEVVVPLK